MKAFTLVSSLLAAAYASPVESVVENFNVETAAPENVALEPIDNPLMKSDKNGYKVLPRFSMTQPKDGGKRQTVKYGSYMVSSTKMMSTTKMSQGPSCAGSCYVVAMEATIRYPGNVEANIDTGAWLHHIALFGSGAGGGSIWAAGNERPTLRLNNKEKYGLDFPRMFMLMIDLMTEETKPKNLTLEISYETVPKMGAGYSAATMYWLTIGEPAARDGAYMIKTFPMTASTPGSLLYAIGHMHDGGDYMSLEVNGREVCRSIMHYNAREGYGKGAAGGEMAAAPKGAKGAKGAAGMEGHGHKRSELTKRQHDHGASKGGLHISDPGACTDFGTVSRGAALVGKAYYNANKYGLMVHNGKREKIMGNMRVYVGGGSAGGLGKLTGKGKMA